MFQVACHDHFRRTISRLTPEERERVLTCVNHLRDGRWMGGTRVKRLEGSDILEARVNDADHLLFSRGHNSRLIIYDVVKHDLVSRRADRRYRRYPLGTTPDEEQADDQDILHSLIPPPDDSENGIAADQAEIIDPWRSRYTIGTVPRLFEPPDELWYDAEGLHSWAQGNDVDVDLLLTAEQRAVAQISVPVILSGSAGSGKSTIIVHSLREHQRCNPKPNALYVTFLPRLRDNAQSLYTRLLQKHPIADEKPDPHFLTYDQLCREILTGAGTPFPVPSDQLVNEANFRVWYENLRQKRRLPYNLLWAELRGVIKGRVLTPDTPMLSKKEHQEIPEAEGLLPTDQRGQAWDYAQVYQQHLQAKGLCDEMDLARAAWYALRSRRGERPDAFRFSVLFCDEVQDLTHLQLSLLLELWKPGGTRLFMTDDEHQVIYPSAFRWHDIMGVFYPIETSQGVRQMPYERRTLTRNFRSSHHVLQLAEATLTRLKRQLLKRFYYRWNAPPDGCHDGPPGLAPIRIQSTLEEILHTLRQLPPSATRVILTHNEEQRDWLTDTLSRRSEAPPGDDTAIQEAESVGQTLVFTVEQYKGLEADCVILWRYFSGDKRFWSEVNAGIEPNRLYETLLECNRLYVALTRPQRYLAIVDAQGDPAPWHLPAFQDLQFEDRGCDWLRAVQKKASSPEEHLRFAELLESNGLYAQAAVAFTNGGDTVSATRCRARLAFLEERWSESGDAWYAVRSWEKARECYQKLDDQVGQRRCDAEQHEDADEWLQAASLWQQAGAMARAAEAWENAGEWDSAHSCWRDAMDIKGLSASEARYINCCLATLDRSLQNASENISNLTLQIPSEEYILR